MPWHLRFPVGLSNPSGGPADDSRFSSRLLLFCRSRGRLLMRSCAQRRELATVLLGLLAVPACAAELPFQNPSLPTEQRVADLVGRLTPEEKISQMTMTAAAIPRLGIPEYT